MSTPSSIVPRLSSRRLASGVLLAALAALLLVPGGRGAAADCDTAPNARAWDGPASGNWGVATSWEGDVLPGPDEIACIGDATVTVDVLAEVDAVVSEENGTLRMIFGGTGLILTPQAGEESQVANLETSRIFGPGSLVVTKSFSGSIQGDPGAGSLTSTGRLVLASSVGADATLIGGLLDGLTLVVEDGVTVTMPAGLATALNPTDGGSIELSGTWILESDASPLFDGNPLSPSVFGITSTGVLRKTGGTSGSQVAPRIVNDGLIENLSSGTLQLGNFGFAPAPGGIGIRGRSDVVVLSGSGRLSPRVTHGDTIVAPGSSPGTIEVIGSPGGWEMRNAAVLAMEVGGTAPGSFDQLRLAGPFAIGTGTTLALSTLPGFQPLPGQVFPIVEASTVTGAFATVTGTALGNGLSFQVSYEPTRVLLTVVGTPTNGRPTAVGDTLVVAEDSAATTVEVLANDTDPETDPLQVVFTAGSDGAAHGQVSCSTASCVYTPEADYAGPDSFTYRARDVFGVSDPALVSITVTPVDDDPVASDDTATVPRDASATAVDVLANDDDVDGDTLAVSAVGAAAHGVTSIGSGGASVLYTPAPGYVGPDSFTYTVSDGAGPTDTATVSIVVTAPASGTITVSLDAQPDDGQDVPFTVLRGVQQVDSFALDDDADPMLPSTRLVGPLDAGQTYVVRLDAGSLTGGWSVTAIACDGVPSAPAGAQASVDLTAGATVDCGFTVTRANRPPVAVDDTLVVEEDAGPVTVGVLTGDGDPDGDDLEVASGGPAAHGTVSCTVGGCTYTAAPDYHGPDSFDYTITDGSLVDIGTVTVTVRPVNDVPVAVDDTATTSQGQPVTIAVVANDTDVDNDTLSVADVDDPAHGSVTCAVGSCTYTPDPGHSGAEVFTYTVSDGAGGEDSGLVTVTVTAGTSILFRSRRTGNGDIYVMSEDGTSQTALTTSPDAESTPVWSPDRKHIAYLRQSGTSGPADLWVMEADGSGQRRLTATPESELAPAWSPDGTRIAFVRYPSGGQSDLWEITADGTKERRITDSPAASEHDPAWSPDGTRIAFTNLSFAGPAMNLEVRVMWANGLGATTLAANGVAPAWSPDGTRIAYHRWTDSTIWSMNADGSGKTQLGSGLNPAWSPGSDRIAFEAFSNLGGRDVWVIDDDGSRRTRLTVDAAEDGEPAWFTPSTVPGPNRAPTAVADAIPIASGMVVRIPVLENDVDLDGDTLVVTGHGDPSHGTVACSSSSCTYRADGGYTGADTFTYRISDGRGGTAEASVTVTVEGHAIVFTSLRAPTFNPDVWIMAEDGSGQASVAVTPNIESDPVWSPDRQKIAFARAGDIWVMNPDGTGQTALTSTAATEEEPAWSPSGTRIAFVRGQNIWVMSAAGGGEVQLTTGGVTRQPAWSPDGTRLAFWSNGGSPGVWVMSSQGRDQQPVMSGGWDPAWSPGGAEIAATRFTRIGTPPDLWAVRPDGSGLRRLTTGPEYDDDAAWSPDGKRIAFARDGAIWTMNADGTAQARLTTVPGFHVTPSWFTATTGPNRGPIAVDDERTIAASAPATAVPVLANDSDLDGDSLTITAVTQGARGTVAITGGGTGLTYDPSGQIGTDTFTYTVNDGRGGTDTATVTVTLTGGGVALVFASDRTGNGDIYRMNADGTGVTRLTTAGADEGEPSASPDGTRIAYRRGSDIWIMNADGSGQQALVNAAGADAEPAFSPDGTQVAFRGRRSGNTDIWVVPAAGGTPVRVTTAEGLDVQPSWSPDGTRIVFASNRGGNVDLYLIDADGTDETRLTTDPAVDRAPDWSPDGTRVAFRSNRSGGTGDIWLVSPDGSGATVLTGAGGDDHPAWSPDGSRLAWATTSAGNTDVSVMQANGSGAARLTTAAAVDSEPDWLPQP